MIYFIDLFVQQFTEDGSVALNLDEEAKIRCQTDNTGDQWKGTLEVYLFVDLDSDRSISRVRQSSALQAFYCSRTIASLEPGCNLVSAGHLASSMPRISSTLK